MYLREEEVSLLVVLAAAPRRGHDDVDLSLQLAPLRAPVLAAVQPHDDTLITWLSALVVSAPATPDTRTQTANSVNKM